MKTTLRGIKYTSIYGKTTPDVKETIIKWDCQLLEYNTYCEVVPKVREVSVEFEDGSGFLYIDSDSLYAEIQGDISEEIFPTDIEINYDNGGPYVQVNFGK